MQNTDEMEMQKFLCFLSKLFKPNKKIQFKKSVIFTLHCIEDSRY